MSKDFQSFQDNPQDAVPSNDEIIQEIESSNEKDYLTQLKKKNKEFLIQLDTLERERIADWIIKLYEDRKSSHDEKCTKIDKWDEVFRMVPATPLGGDGNDPNYRFPLSTVTLEVVHANVMNVIHAPKDIVRVLPTEENDIPKVKKLSIFANWSMDNELDIFGKTDRLFHSSAKNGECPWMMDWCKEYGTEIVREPIMNPADPTQPLVDPDTKEVIFQEKEKQKLLYNAPKLTIFSLKDYIAPQNALIGKPPAWEMVKVRIRYDEYFRDELQGKMYSGSSKEIVDWSGGQTAENMTMDYMGDAIDVGKEEKEFLYFYGRMRVNTLKANDNPDDPSEYEELEDEFIGIVEIKDRVLCQLRKNKFPLKERPVELDMFIPDDEGRREGMGVMEMMDGPQTSYDALGNQFIKGVVQSNDPFGFFTPMGNLRNEPMKIKNGFLFPTSDPQSVNIVKLPPPDSSLKLMMDTVNYWAQLLFGISDYSAGVESTIDPSASGKKVQEVLGQGSTRLNIIIKRKNETMKKIFRKWFLLYKENMPPNKFMRIAGDGDNPFKFEKISYSDFDLSSIPDFELTGNILNVNKALEAQKRFAVYNNLIRNPFFLPNTTQGLQALHSLTKWLIDGIDDNSGLSRLLPDSPGDHVHTPEEENSRFLQGDEGMPSQNEDHVHHIQIHNQMINDPNVPDEIKQIVAMHIKEHIKMLQQLITQQMVMGQPSANPMQPQTGGVNGQQPNQAGTPGQDGPYQGVPQGQPAGMGGY